MDPTTDKEQKNIMQFYGAFAAAILTNFVPLAIVQIFGLCLLLAVLIGAYVYKARASLDSLTYNHMTYLIGTIWVSSFLLLIGMAVATYWVYSQGDHTAIQTVVNGISGGVMYSPEQLQSVMMDYIHQNKSLLILATVTTIGPGVLYILYRTIHGVSRASKGYRIARPAGWF